MPSSVGSDPDVARRDPGQAVVELALALPVVFVLLLGVVQVAVVVYEMMTILRRHRVRVNATFTMVNIAIAVTEGIGKQLDPTLDLLNEAMPFFMALSL